MRVLRASPGPSTQTIGASNGDYIERTTPPAASTFPLMEHPTEGVISIWDPHEATTGIYPQNRKLEATESCTEKVPFDVYADGNSTASSEAEDAQQGPAQTEETPAQRPRCPRSATSRS